MEGVDNNINLGAPVKNFAERRIAISGSSGFIGSNLSEALLKEGVDIYPVIRNGKHDTNMRSVEFKFFDAAFSDANNIDTFIHLAGKAHDTADETMEDEYIEINTGLTRHMFDTFLASGAELFIYMSSIKAVVDHSNHIITEDFIPDPQTPYGKSKRMAEEYILQHALTGKKRVIILRTCIVHGPGNKGNLNLLYQFVKSGNPYPLGAFDNRRSFLGIDNFCFVINEILLSQTMPSGIYHLGDDDPLSTVAIIQEIGVINDMKPRIWRFNPGIIRFFVGIGDVLHLPINSSWYKKLTENYIISNKKIKSALNIQLPVSSRTGIRKTIMSFKDKSGDKK